jgi:uncharacterized protein (DUF4415 family)
MPTSGEDAQIREGIAADPDNPEWTKEDFANAKPASEFFGPEVFATLPKARGRPVGSVAERTKVALSMRVDPDVLEAMRASGAGWQTRVNDLLRREFIRGNRKAASRD